LFIFYYEEGQMSKTAKMAVQLLAGASLLGVPVAFMASPASATNWWGGYHWARTANPFAIVLGKNVSQAWVTSVQQASSDWSVSTVLDTSVGTGGVNSRTCKPTSGKVQVCSAKYGNNGWLGLAQIWLNGSHITQGINKLNDSYFSLSTYNKPEWRALVACQEIGHTFGLDHQDENQTNTNLGTCMDYTKNPLGAGAGTATDNTHPNGHDRDELDKYIYSHTDSTSTVAIAAVASAAPADDWGKAVRFTKSGKGRVFVKDLGPNRQVVTFVTWASE
jgi:hypothetical protein